MTELEKLLDKGSELVMPTIEENSDISVYVDCIKEIIRAIGETSKEEIDGLDYVPEVIKTLRMDKSLLGTAITEEADQVSLISTLVCYIHSNRSGLPNHSMVYMDRITLLRGKIEAHYQTRAERFCGSDVCMG